MAVKCPRAADLQVMLTVTASRAAAGPEKDLWAPEAGASGAAEAQVNGAVAPREKTSRPLWQLHPNP